MSRKSSLREKLLLTSHFSPGGVSKFNSESVAHRLSIIDENSVELALQGILDEGLIEIIPPVTGSRQFYRPTERGFVARETLLRGLGRRHPCLVNQRAYSPEDLVLALAINKDEVWRVDPPSGAFLRGGSFSQIPIDTCYFYLDKFSSDEVDSAINSLVSRGFVRIATSHSRVGDGKAVEITLSGETLYKVRVRQALGIPENSFILQEMELDVISVFFSWQSDFPESSNQIRSALNTWVDEANASFSLMAPMKIVEATASSDGAVRIDTLIIERIKDAHFFVADITPVYKYGGRACPNPNVLIELGYALAKKDACEILLLLKKRETKEIPGDGAEPRLPFDVASVKHEPFESVETAKESISRILTAMLSKRGFVWNGQAAPGP